MRVTGTVEEWESWTRMAYPETGSYGSSGAGTRVSTVKKSQATMLAACARRDSRELGPVRLVAGPRPVRASKRRTVLGETEKPSFVSSPAIR
jgi:hypothetical protein